MTTGQTFMEKSCSKKVTFGFKKLQCSYYRNKLPAFSDNRSNTTIMFFKLPAVMNRNKMAVRLRSALNLTLRN